MKNRALSLSLLAIAGFGCGGQDQTTIELTLDHADALTTEAYVGPPEKAEALVAALRAALVHERPEATSAAAFEIRVDDRSETSGTLALPEMYHATAPRLVAGVMRKIAEDHGFRQVGEDPHVATVTQAIYKEPCTKTLCECEPDHPQCVESNGNGGGNPYCDWACAVCAAGATVSSPGVMIGGVCLTCAQCAFSWLFGF